MRFSTHLSLSLTLLSWVAVVRSQNCMLQVPANPLTAQGLATPYVLTGCNQIDFANQGAFVEAAILDPATGSIQIYSPLVINAGMTPVGNATSSSSSATTGTHTSTGATSIRPTTGVTTSAAKTASASASASVSVSGGTTTPSTRLSSSASSKPTTTTASTRPATTFTPRQAASAGSYIPPIVPTLPNNAVVGIWFGSNAGSVTLTGDTASCVNGLGGSVFGQFAYCNGPAWMAAAKIAVNRGLIKLPPPGTGTGGQACPTTHDFRVVDQDPSDNVVTTYLLIGGNTLAQNTPANSKANPNAEELSNASDNALVTQFIDPALGCAPFQNPCPTCPSGKGPALATDELLAFFFPPAGGPALVPLNDPMVLVNGQPSLDKVNLYRVGAGQPFADQNNASGLAFCKGITQAGIFTNSNEQLFTNSPSPAPNMATNLFTFLAMRLSASFGPAPGLGCTGLLNVANPVALTMDGNGVVTAATVNTQLLQQIVGGLTGNTTTSTSASVSKTATSTSVSKTASSTSLSGTASSTSLSGTASSTSISGTASSTSAGKTTVATASTPTGVLLRTTSGASSTQTLSTASASPTWGWHHHHGGYRWKRITPFAAERLRRKSRIESFE